MSNPTYAPLRSVREKPLVWLEGEVKTPPFTASGRREAGDLLRLLQRGESLALPHARPMPSIGRGCHELRIRDAEHDWRIVLCIDRDAIVILDGFEKRTRRTPREVIRRCRRRLGDCGAAAREPKRDGKKREETDR